MRSLQSFTHVKMNWFNYVAFLLLLFTFTLAAETSSKPPATLVWVTGTDSNGQTKTTQSAYSQIFSSMYSQVALPSSGSVSMGSLSGKVGDVRSYLMVTISKGGANHHYNNIQGGDVRILHLAVSAVGATLAVIALL